MSLSCEVSSDNKPKRVGNISKLQKDLMVEFMQKHPKLHKGKLNNDFTCANAKALWVELTSSLNCIPGASKTWEQWRKTWSDQKNSAKKVGATIANHRRGTGGGAPLQETLTEVQNKIVQMIGVVAVDGQNTKENEIKFDFESHEVDEVAEESLNATADVTDECVKENSMTSGPHGTKRSYHPSAKSKQLIHTMNATPKLAEISKEKLDMKQRYYDEKIKILKKKNEIYAEDVESKKLLASALNNLCERLR